MATDFFRNQKVLVTGGAGLIGSCAVKRLSEAGAIVRAVYHKTEPAKCAEGVTYLQADLTNAEDCRSVVEGVSYVFHCAAHTPGAGATASDPLAHVTSNIIIDALMLEAAYGAGVKKFIWLGSMTAYPPTGEHPVKEEEMFSGDSSSSSSPVFFSAASWNPRWATANASWIRSRYSCREPEAFFPPRSEPMMKRIVRLLRRSPGLSAEERAELGALVLLVEAGTASGPIAKDIFSRMVAHGGDPRLAVQFARHCQPDI